MIQFKKYRKQERPVNNGTFRTYEEFLTLEEGQWASRIHVCTSKQALLDIYNNFNNIKAKELVKVRLRTLNVKVGDEVKKIDLSYKLIGASIKEEK